MITRKHFLITLFAVASSLAAVAQVHEDGVQAGNPVSAGEPVKKVELYPNPVIEYLNIKFEAPCGKRVKLTVHNIIGNIVEIEPEMIDEHDVSIKMTSLPSGYYLLSIHDPDTNFKGTYKFLKR